MTEFLIYQGKAAIALAVFYMFYRLLLSKETFHCFNRIMLLGTAALSFVLPLCVITVSKVEMLPYSVTTDLTTGLMTETAAAVVENADRPVLADILFGIFAVGALAVLVTTLLSIMRVRSIIRSGQHRMLESGETLVTTDLETAPFSWMHYIVISREDYESGREQILTHEQAHIALRHSWDILFVDMITALQWFNPAIWMLKADLRALHEFEADDAVLRSGANIKEYQYLLIRKAVGKSGYSVANSFNHSTLKQRITMMLNKKSSRMSAWKALYVIPLVGISLAATAETKVDYRYEDQQLMVASDTPDGKDSKTFKEKNLHEAHLVVDEDNRSIAMVYYDAEGKEYRSEWSGLDLSNNVYMVNGALVSKELFEQSAENEAVIISAYLKSGRKAMAVVTPHRTFLSGKSTIIDQRHKTEAEPQKQELPVPDVYIDGKKATSEDLKGLDMSKMHGHVEADGTIQISTDKAVETELEVMPKFGDGYGDEFSKWVQENIRYPEGTTNAGRVTVSFTISETGKVTDAKVLRGIDSKLDDEALRVINTSPDWTPGTENGKPVPVRMVIPVDFKR